MHRMDTKRAAGSSRSLPYLASVLVLGLTLGPGLVGCGDDEDPAAPGAEPVEFALAFSPVVGTESLLAAQLRYTNAAQNEFSVDKFEFLLTDVVLVRADAAAETLSAALYVDAFDDATHRSPPRSVPAGVYTALRFRWGVRPEVNTLGFLPPGLDGMVWPSPLGGGYHCMRLEGTYTQAAPGDRSYKLHAGVLQRGGITTVGSVEIELPLGNLRLEGPAPVTLGVFVDVLRTMDTPAIDLRQAWSDQSACPITPLVCTFGDPSMPSHEVQGLLRDNAADIFRLTAAPAGSSGPTAFDPTPELLYDNPLYFGGRTLRLPRMPQPSDNPTTREGVALGRRLFHDRILSLDLSQSCATCHVQTNGFAEPNPVSRGVTGAFGHFNASALINLGWSSQPLPGAQPRHVGVFWDGRARSLEEQALAPVPSVLEMNLPWDVAIERLRSHPDYPRRFGEAFPGRAITPDLVSMALAQFQRTLISFDSKYDRVMRGESSFTAAEARGYEAFNLELADCFHCHGHPFYLQDVGSSNFANNGLDAVIDPQSPGLFGVTGEERDRGRFRVPTLRNIAYTAPYMHDGRFASLDEVVEHYSSGVQLESPNLDANLRIRAQRGPFSAQTKADLVAFLLTLSDPNFVTDPAFGDPFEQASSRQR